MKKSLINNKNKIMINNNGFSLVELLVSIAIGAIVSGTIASLLIYCIRMYGKQTVDVEMQQQIQLASNMIIDSVMESESFIAVKSVENVENSNGVKTNVESTDTVILGKFGYVENSKQLSFDGYVLCSNNVKSDSINGCLYIKKYNGILDARCINSGEASSTMNVDEVVNELTNGVIGAEGNLLVSKVEYFNICPSIDSIATDNYSNPFSVDIDIVLSKKWGFGIERKELHDTIAMRNTLKSIYKTGSYEMSPVCIGVKSNDGTITWETYMQPQLTSKNKKITTVTESVRMKEALGYIETEVSGDDASFNILEIVPNYSYDYIQYTIGGKADGDFICDSRHYADAEEYKFEPITCEKINEYIAKTCTNKWQWPTGNGKFYLNGGDIPHIVAEFKDNQWKLYNNELFKLFVLQDSVEQCAEGKRLDITNGAYEWDGVETKWLNLTSANKDELPILKCDLNYNAVNVWNKTNVVNLYVSTPEALKSDWIKIADLILIGGFGYDGGFNWANQFYKDVMGGNKMQTDGGDISFDNMMEIYNRVCDKDVAIACTFDLLNSGNLTNNLNCLHYYLYEFEHKKIKDKKYNPKSETYIKGTYRGNEISYLSDIEKNITPRGTGRDILQNQISKKFTIDSKSILEEIQSDFREYSYKGASLKYDFSDYLAWNDCIDNSMGSDWFVQIYANQLRFKNTSDLLNFKKDGGQGFLTLQIINQNRKKGGEKETLGDITIVGASIVDDVNGRIGKDGDNTGEGGTSFSESNNKYSIDVVMLSAPVTIGTGSSERKIDKVIYLTDIELEKAKEKGLKLYCLINATDGYDDINEVNVNASKVKADDGENVIAKYNPEENFKISNKDVQTTIECECTMSVPEGTDTGIFDKTLTAKAEIKNGSKIATGSDEVLVVVRDLFDLD